MFVITGQCLSVLEFSPRPASYMDSLKVGGQMRGLRPRKPAERLLFGANSLDAASRRAEI